MTNRPPMMAPADPPLDEAVARILREQAGVSAPAWDLTPADMKGKWVRAARLFRQFCARRGVDLVRRAP